MVVDLEVGERSMPRGRKKRTKEGDGGRAYEVVGKAVRKRFGDAYFHGVVDGYDEAVGWYHVSYEDGDEEELTLQEVEEVLNAKGEKNTKAHATDKSKHAPSRKRSRRNSSTEHDNHPPVHGNDASADAALPLQARNVTRWSRKSLENAQEPEEREEKESTMVDLVALTANDKTQKYEREMPTGLRTARKSAGGAFGFSPVLKSVRSEPEDSDHSDSAPKDQPESLTFTARKSSQALLAKSSPPTADISKPADETAPCRVFNVTTSSLNEHSVQELPGVATVGACNNVDPDVAGLQEQDGNGEVKLVEPPSIPKTPDCEKEEGKEEIPPLFQAVDASKVAAEIADKDTNNTPSAETEHPQKGQDHAKKHALKSARVAVEEGDLLTRPYYADEIQEGSINPSSTPVYRPDLLEVKLGADALKKVEVPAWVFEYPEDCEEQVKGRIAVKQTLRHFHRQHMAAIREENERVMNAAREDGKRTSRRPDLVALTKMNALNLSIKDYQKTPGCLPGIPVGRKFYSRVETVVVGLHGHWLQGISYVKLKGSEDVKSYSTSIVVGGFYEDDADGGDTLLYTGQGGNDLLGSRRQIADQLLERGNEALVGNMMMGIPVRVIRKNADASSYTGNVFIYDGLYQVEGYWGEKGISGFLVYRFRLRRLPGQPDISSNEVHWREYISSLPRKLLPSQRAGFLVEDIAMGMEKHKIPVVNTVDETPAPVSIRYGDKWPDDASEVFQYITSCAHLPSVPEPKPVEPLTMTELLKLNDGTLPYVDNYRIAEPKHVVFEAAPNARIEEDMRRQLSVTQNGIHYRLEVFRTEKKGWGVRSWDTIPAGAYVCDFTGEIMTQDEAESRGNDDYIFDLDCIQTAVGIGGRNHRGTKMTLNPNLHVEVPEYALDGYRAGNIGRFINHSPEPNLFVQCVLEKHHDLNIPRICFFASDNIPPMTELCYDYGHDYVSIKFKDGVW